MKRSVHFISFLLGALSLSGQVTVLVDFGTSTTYRGSSVNAGGSAGLDENGNYWNSISSSAYWTNLVAQDNSATTIDTGFLSGLAGGTDSYNGPAGATTAGSDYVNADIDSGALGDLGAKQAAFDYFTSSVIVFNQLDPSLTYTFTFYGSHKYNTLAASTTVYTLYNASPGNLLNSAGAGVVGSASLNINDDNITGFEWNHNRNRVTSITFSGLSSVHLGWIASDNTSAGYLNAMSITAVPEPSAYALYAGCMALGLILWRRRLRG